jgi:hypothetical protein
LASLATSSGFYKTTTTTTDKQKIIETFIHNSIKKRTNYPCAFLRFWEKDSAPLEDFMQIPRGT